jgi:hypothetical protein
MKKHLTLTCILLSYILSSQVTIIQNASVWKYKDDGSNQGTAWYGTSFNDASWSSGAAELGYGDSDEATVVNACGTVTPLPTCTNKYITTYFRQTFTLAGVASFTSFTANLRRDDGIVLYMNGIEVYRNNMPTGLISHTTLASAAASDDGATILNATIPTSLVVSGTNVVAAEIHQNAGTSSDLTFILSLVGNTVAVTPATVSIFPNGSNWKYLDNGTDQGSAWYATSFNDGSWASGNGELGYGDGDETTVIGYGGNASAKYPTTYFRKTFSVTTSPSYTAYALKLKRDDGIIVYINGSEVYRENMPTSGVNYTTYASTNCADDGGSIWTATIPASIIVSGTNVIAAEIHQTNATSSDLTFELNMIAITNSIAPMIPAIIKGPYLQVATPTSMLVRWETNFASDSKVMYGTNAASLTSSIINSIVSVTHSVNLTGLTPYTKYYYNIGSSTLSTQGDTNNYFLTLPVPGTPGNYRFWVVSDCGNGSTNQVNCKNAYKNYAGNRPTNGWLHAGDLVYTSGTNAEYNASYFNIYQNDVMKNIPMFPAPGNHDYNNGATTTTTVPYFSIFSTPSAGQSGGVASNNPAYYSYDYGNIHFIALDSYGTTGASQKMYDTTGAQVLWLKADLAANIKPWIIAYWHHPPYTMGSHNSDTEGDLVAIRTNFIRILERNKVDLIITSHSHDYERSKLMNGHYGNEASFNASTHHLSSSSALYNGSVNSCPYEKDSVTKKIGTVYVVTGSAGQLGGQQTSFPHNAMFYSNATNGGSCILDIEDNKLNLKWLCADGVIRDEFTMVKEVKKVQTYTVAPGQTLSVSASWPGAYVWSNSVSARSTTISANSNTDFWVKDPNTCLADTFKLKVLPSVSFSATPPFCVTSPIQFNDGSTNNVSSWLWVVTPSVNVTISNSTAQNPNITFGNTGTYTVSLVSANAYGLGTPFTQTLLVNSNPTVSVVSSATAVCANQSATLTANGASSYLWSNSATSGSIIITPSVTITYTLIGYTSNGCQNSTTRLMTINPLPTITVISSPTNATVCNGNTVMLSASGANSYTWSGGITNATAFTPTINATYTVTGTDANGCQNTAVNSLTVNPNPTISISGGTVICSGQTSTLTASGASTYSWSNNINLANAIVNPSVSATYSVVGINANGCFNSASQFITVNPLPNITVNSGNVCPGYSFTLNPSGANTYTYSNGSNIVSPMSNSIYSITGTSSLGCTSSVPVMATVSVINTLTISVSGPTAICIGSSANLTASGASSFVWNNGSNTNTISISPLSNTTYTVIGSSSNCSNVGVFAVSINTLPIVSIVSSQTEICVGNSVNLIANGANSYMWNIGTNNPTITLSPSTSTTYTLTGYNSNGCLNTVSQLIKVNLLPVVLISSSGNTICVGESATLTASGTNGYVWNDGTTAAINIVSPTNDKIYSVNGTDFNGCSNSSSLSLKVNACTGIEETIKAAQIKVYPNPSSGTLFFEVSDNKELTLTIYNALGQLVVKSKLNKGTNTIVLQEIKGIYFYNLLEGSRNVTTGKLIIN